MTLVVLTAHAHILTSCESKYAILKAYTELILYRSSVAIA